MKDFAQYVLKTLLDAGFKHSYLCGGSVRDLLLGRIPKDYDIATSATPDQVRLIFPESNLVGASFGVVICRSPDHLCTVEVATFRTEGAYSDGRRPDVVKFETSPEADVQRRDFTINGLLMSFAGDIIDYVGGQADLKAGIIRAINNPVIRFEEDYLRMLRAIRFAARFNFTLEQDTAGFITVMADRITKISTERVRDEFSRILTEGGAAYGLQLLRDTNLLQYIMPELLPFVGCEQSPDHHPEGDVWNHILKMLGRLDLMVQAGTHSVGSVLPLALGVLLHDIAKPETRVVGPGGRIKFHGHAERGATMARTILLRLMFPTAIVVTVCTLVSGHMDFMQVESMRKSTLKRFIRQPDFDQLLNLHMLDCLGSSGDLGHYRFVLEQVAQLPEEVIRPVRLITGKSLIELGYRPGPLFTTALAAVEEAQLNETISTSEEAILIAKSILDAKGTIQ